MKNKILSQSTVKIQPRKFHSSNSNDTQNTAINGVSVSHRGFNHNMVFSLVLHSHKRGHSISTLMAQWVTMQGQYNNTKIQYKEPSILHNAKQRPALTVCFFTCHHATIFGQLTSWMVSLL